MNVRLLQDIPNVGLAGQIKKVKEGYARNFLFPKNLAARATKEDIKNAEKFVAKSAEESALAGSRIAALTEQIKRTNLIIKRKASSTGKLFGALGEDDIVEALKAKNIIVTKKQVMIEKAIRMAGEHVISIKLSSKLRPKLTVKVSAIEETAHQ